MDKKLFIKNLCNANPFINKKEVQKVLIESIESNLSDAIQEALNS